MNFLKVWTSLDSFCSKTTTTLFFLFLTTTSAVADCRSNNLTPGDSTITIEFGGRTRTFDVHVPPGYSGRFPVSLVLDLHGFTSNSRQQAAISGFREKSNEVGFIVVYPQGVSSSWNAFGCCGTADLLSIDDVGFLRAVVNRIGSIGHINHSRVYITGLSNGGFMSHRMACEAADVFAAAAPVSAPLNLDDIDECRPVRPITVNHFHGLRDTTVPYEGGGILDFQSAQSSLGFWKQIDDCTGSPTLLALGGSSRCETFSSCRAGVKPGLCSLDGTHVLYAQSILSIADYAWDSVFSQHFLELPDQDGDGVPDRDDNCPATHNPGQEDLNGDCIGDACIASARPVVTAAEVSGKKLFVHGSLFQSGAVILINGEEQKTKNDPEASFATLIGKKAGKKIAPGQTVKVQVQNPDGGISDEFSLTRQ